MKHLIITLIMLISINLKAQDFSEQQGGHCYTIDIPDYMHRTYELNDVASLQYMNFDRESYVIVIEDNKEHLESVNLHFNSLNDFLLVFVNTFKTDEESRTVSDILEFANNDNAHSQIELTWTENNLNYFMLITAVETPTHYYKIMCWTLVDNRARQIDDFRTISSSLID